MPCNRNEPKQSINTTWQITEVSNSAKQKVNISKTERQMYGCHESYLQIFTHNLALSASSRLLHRYLLPLLELWLCSSAQLGIWLWPRELDKPPWSWRRRRLLHSSKTLPVERVERSDSQTPVGRIAKWHLPLTIFLSNLLFFTKALHLGKCYNRF